MKNKRVSPIMGWASWNNYRINISEELIKKQIDAMIDLGLDKVGYTYINIDDGFFCGRNEDGSIKPHPKRFPNGMKVISDYAHSKGIKAGIYSDAGDNTCAHIYDNKDKNSDGVGVGLYHHDEEDLKLYLIDWDFDYIKVDWCGGKVLGLSEEERYTKIGEVIDLIRDKKQKDVIYNVCRWQFPGEWVVNIADSWRVSTDISLDFKSVMMQIDKANSLSKYQFPGHQNDLDMLQVGRGLTKEEDKTHFAMWCMMSTPLILGNDLTTIKEETLSIIKNERLIAINQDKLCAAPKRVFKSRQYEIWIKDLENSGEKALAILNKTKKKLDIKINLSDFGINNVTMIEDLWDGSIIETNGVINKELLPHSTLIYRISAEFENEKINEIEKNVLKKKRFITLFNAQSNENSIYVDVRTNEEYAISHIDGSINIPHTDIMSKAKQIIPNKNSSFVVFCSTGKRSFQAKENLNYLGYTNVTDQCVPVLTNRCVPAQGKRDGAFC